MTIKDYQTAKKNLSCQENRLFNLSRQAPSYQRELYRYINLLITVKGHAWSMDVKKERSKMADLITKSIKELPVI